MSSSSNSIAAVPRLDTSDPRRFDRVRPFTLPAEWRTESVDAYGSLLASASIISGGALLTRMPYFAYLGLIFALAHIAHNKPLSIRASGTDTTGGPWTSLAFALVSIALTIFQKVAGPVIPPSPPRKS